MRQGRALKKISRMHRRAVYGLLPLSLLLLGCLWMSPAKAQSATTLIDPATNNGGFENGTTGWTFVNGSQANKWQVSTGATAGFAGLQCAYISESAAAPFAHTYNINTTSTTQFYQDVVFPAGETAVSLSFNMIAGGESSTDRLTVYLAPTTVTPAAGTDLGTTNQIGSDINFRRSWTGISLVIPASLVGNATAATTRRLIFQWRNDGSVGVQPPAAIDDITLVSASCTGVALLNASNINTTAATLNWTPLAGATGYEVRYRKISDPVTIASWATPAVVSGGSAASLYVSGLTGGGRYIYQVRATGGTACAYYNLSRFFATPCTPVVPASLPYAQDFESWTNNCGTTDIPAANAINEPFLGDNSWRRDDQGVSADWRSPASYIYSPVFTTGSRSARFHSGYARAGLMGIMDFYLNLSTPGSKQVYFDYINTSGSDSLYVELSGDGGLSWTLLGFCTTVSAWTSFNYNTNVTAANAILRFRARADFGSTDIGLDNLIVAPPCTGTPVAGTASAATASFCTTGSTILSLRGNTLGSSIQWDSSSNGTTWFPVAGAVNVNYTTPVLTATTYYRARVTCTQTAISNVITITIGPPAVTPATLPFTESFENWISGCSQTDRPGISWLTSPATGNNSWRRDDQGTSASWGNNSYAYSPVYTTGSHSARFHSGYSTAGLMGIMDLYIDLSPTGSKQISFDYINTSGSDSLYVELSTNGGTAWTLLGFRTTASAWTNVTYNTTATAANAILRFRARADYGSTDVGIDNLQIFPLIPLCVSTPAAPLNGSSVCSNSVTLRWPAAARATSYDVYLNAGTGTPTTIVSAAQTDTTYTAAIAPGPYTWMVIPRNANGAASGCAAFTFTAGTFPAAAITYTGATTFCKGNPLTLNAPAGAGLTYQWNNNGSPVPGATAATYAADTSGAYTVTVTNAAQCSFTTATPVNITANPAPPATITVSGSATFCTGSVILSAPPSPAGKVYKYVWKDNNAAVVPAQTGQTFTVNTSRNVTVTVTDSLTGCNATTAVATVITTGAAPVAPISSAASPTLCQGQTVRLRTNNAPGLSYQWYLGGAPIPGAIDSTYDAGQAGSYTVAVSIAGAAGCSATSVPLTLTVNPLPVAAITASGAATTFCSGGSVTLTGNAGTNLNYQWQDGTAPAGGINTGAAYTATTGGSYRLIVTNNTTQCSNTSNIIPVTVNPLPAATITAASSTAICQGASVVLNANTGAGLAYAWFNGSGPVGGNTASYTANAAGSYTVTVTNANNCSATSAATTVTVNPLPPSTVTPSGLLSICAGSSVTLNGPTTPAGLSYQWKNGTANAAGTATAASYTATAAGNYRLVVTSVSGCKDSSSVAAVSLLPLPAVAMTPAVALAGCDSVVLRTADTGVTFQWNFNGAPILGATTRTYTARVSGTYSLTNVDPLSRCAATATGVPITVNQSPVGQITYSSPLTFCQGGAVVLNTYAALNQTYEWRNNGVAIPGATDFSYITTQSGVYFVYVTNTATNCSRVSQTVIVQVNPLPMPQVVYNHSTNTLSTAAPYAAYQWYLNTQPIANATRATHQPVSNGAYTVSITDTNGCTNIAPIVFVNNVGVENSLLATQVRVYPNPVAGVLYVSSPVVVNLSLRDITGRVVLAGVSGSQLDVTSLSDGTYLLYITTRDGRLIRAEQITKKQM